MGWSKCLPAFPGLVDPPEDLPGKTEAPRTRRRDGEVEGGVLLADLEMQIGHELERGARCRGRELGGVAELFRLEGLRRKELGDEALPSPVRFFLLPLRVTV